MCRYAMCGPYKRKWACFGCRKSFKKSNHESLRPRAAAEIESQRALCSQCRQPMHDMGLDFKAPRQSDREQWRKVEMLLVHGYRYSSCGCSGPGFRPSRLRDVPAFLAAKQQQATQQQRLFAVSTRANALRARRKKKRRQLEDKRIERLAT